MKEIITKEKEFKDLIYVIRGQQVMLDSDLAELYGYEVKRLNEQVSRNISKFPNDFMFVLTYEEMVEVSKSQFATTIQTKGVKGGRTSKIRAFTEIGVYMLATILKGDTATQQTIFIMRSFSKMRHYLAENKLLLRNEEILDIYNRLDKHEADINKIMDNFLDKDNIKEKIFLDGQVFDANETYNNIYKQAKKSIFIIDDYINMNTLHLLKHKQKNIHVSIFTSNKGNDKLTKFEVDNFHKQYPAISIKYTGKVHDRFIVIDYETDNEQFYICGASSKDAGQKICTITQMYDKENLHLVIDKLLKSKDYVF